MGYILPSEVPAWKVTIYVIVAGFVRFAPKPSVNHKPRVFRTLKAAQAWGWSKEAGAKWSLIPYQLEARITEVSVEPTFYDKFLAALNMRPRCGSLQKLYQNTGGMP